MKDITKLPWLPERRDGKRLHLSTVYRWAQRGMKGVRLETIQFGGTRCTSESALLRFCQSLAADAQDGVAVPPQGDLRRPAFERAEKLLAKAGI